MLSRTSKEFSTIVDETLAYGVAEEHKVEKGVFRKYFSAFLKEEGEMDKEMDEIKERLKNAGTRSKKRFNL
uniref:Uncharacterized protein n=1 Tax=Candidatus Kentrum sp. LPFa TaxID=2126335 RepID=A0A450XH25_9GAMM|nr:MAG: hypothetical protein BECKLPF1236A_GA0070988_100882 [Candidatus Kentron sp. LPFa]VFK28620.1 MAG: hypothetical protein BECKLPF1236C_GA0070990_100702 [Candidatus Kentron sp. LPFa]